MNEVLSVAIGAVVVLASLFGFQVLADKVFVSRREFDAFRHNMEDRLGRIEGIIDTRFAQLMARLDLMFGTEKEKK